MDLHPELRLLFKCIVADQHIDDAFALSTKI